MIGINKSFENIVLKLSDENFRSIIEPQKRCWNPMYHTTL